MIEIIGIVVGVIGIGFSAIELKARWPKIKHYWKTRRLRASAIGMGKESLRFHASPKFNTFVLKDASSDFKGDVLLSLSFREEGIYLSYYDTENSPFYLLTTFPVRLLLPQPVKERISWEECGPSNNGFHVSSISRVVSLDERVTVPAGEFLCAHVETHFKYPLSYSGPRMETKDIYWAHGVGPVLISVKFCDSSPCVGKLFDYTVMQPDGYWPMHVDNTWNYLWTLSRPNNNKNVSDVDEEVKTTLFNPPL